jgi:hypothetical protein
MFVTGVKSAQGFFLAPIFFGYSSALRKGR